MKQYQRPEMDVERLRGEIALMESNELPILGNDEEEETEETNKEEEPSGT